MKIAFVNSTHGWTGVKTWCLDMAQALIGLGHQAILYGRAGEFVDRARERGLTAHAVAFGPDFNPLAVIHFVREFHAEGVGAVVGNVSKDLRSAGVAARLLKLPLMQHIGQSGDLRDTWKTRAQMRLLRPHLLPCCVSVQQDLLQRLPFLYPTGSTPIATGVTPVVDPRLGRHDPPVLLTTSQLRRDKGHDDLLHAYRMLSDAGLEFRAVIAGSGSEETRLKALCKELDLDDHVRFVGFVRNVRYLLRTADVFVLPSHAEGLPLSLQEAMAEGLIPVARDVGGVAEVWPGACPELLVEDLPGEVGVETLAVALTQVLSLDEKTFLERRRAVWQHCRDTCDVTDKARTLAATAEWLATSKGTI